MVDDIEVTTARARARPEVLAVTTPPVVLAEPPRVIMPSAPVQPDAKNKSKGKGGTATISMADNTLDAVMGEVAKLHGPNIIRPARQALTGFLHVPTNIFTMDMATFGGFVATTVTQLIGWESSGKTTTALRAVAQAQRMFPDQRPVYIDVEGTLDGSWAGRHGVDMDRLILAQPEHGEMAVDICDAVIRARDTSIVVLDSLPALMPIKEMEKSAEDSVIALQARLVGLLVRKATQALLDERKKGHMVSLILINQWRNRIVMMGDPRQAPGGNALKFFTYLRIEVKNQETLGKDEFDVETVEFNQHSFQVTKNKRGTGIRNGEFRLIRNPSHPLGQGYVDDEPVVVTYARKFGICTGAGSSWRLDDVDTRFGKLSEINNYLYENPEYCERLKRRLITQQRVNSGLPADGWYL